MVPSVNGNSFLAADPYYLIRYEQNRFLNKNQLKHDIIFADPPYQFTIEDYTDLIDSIFDLTSLTSEGLLVIEHEKKIQFSKHDMFYFDKKYGGTMLSFFKKASL